MIGRRALLTGAIGAAGLAVGAGGTEAANAITHRPDTGTHLPSPGEELMVEHGVLKRLLLAYRAVIDKLDAGATVPPGAVGDAAQIMSDYIESFHEGLEEGYVFPRVADDHAGLVRTLLVQHDHGRHLTASVLDVSSTDLHAASARAALRRDLAAFVRMYEPHEAWEDTVIYPALRRATTQHTIDLLAERFADLENKQYGDDALNQMLSRIGGIEEQLGIADLASFTPDVR